MTARDDPEDNGEWAASMEPFLNAFAENLNFLGDARKALLSHPLPGADYGSVDAAVCRLTVVVIVDAIEDGLLGLWRGESYLVGYFDRKSSAKERIESLVGGFHKTGVEANPSVISDLLALRYLRNAWSHARLKSHEKEYLELRGLEAQVGAPDKRLLDLAGRVASEMNGYISRAGLSSNRVVDEPRPVTSVEIGSSGTSGSWSRVDRQVSRRRMPIPFGYSGSGRSGTDGWTNWRRRR